MLSTLDENIYIYIYITKLPAWLVHREDIHEDQLLLKGD